MILFSSFHLSAQIPESLAGRLFIVFHSDQVLQNYEELYDFVQEYNQYQLKIMFKYSTLMLDNKLAFFIYNRTIISQEEIVDLIQNDPRVGYIEGESYEDNVFLYITRPRQFTVLFNEGADEEDFLNCYSEYGFRGGVSITHPTFVEKFYTINDTLIYPGIFLDILWQDSRVQRVDFARQWMDGMISIVFDSSTNEEIIQEVFDDYDYITFTFSWDTPSIIVYRGEFNYLEYNEFEVFETLNNEERILRVTYADAGSSWDGIFPPPRPNIPITLLSEKEDSLKLKSNIYVYPNPVNNINVSFKWDTKSSINSKLYESSEISIFNVKGQRINQLTYVGDTYNWNLKDKNNNEIGSGIYFYLVKSGNDTHTGKILIIK